jgi:hypothetical protein
MRDRERFRHHRTNTAATGKSRERNQQVAEQSEQQAYNSERNSNRLSTVGKPALRHPILPNQQFATHRVMNRNLIRPNRGPVAEWAL